MSEEIKNVVNGQYQNPKLDAYLEDLLYVSMLKLDMSTYICARVMRTKAITDNFEDIYQQKEETTLGL